MTLPAPAKARRRASAPPDLPPRPRPDELDYAFRDGPGSRWRPTTAAGANLALEMGFAVIELGPRDLRRWGDWPEHDLPRPMGGEREAPPPEQELIRLLAEASEHLARRPDDLRERDLLLMRIEMELERWR